MICFSGLRRTLYRPGSRLRSCAAWSNRSIIASKGFSSARNVSLSGRMIAGEDCGLIAGSLMSLAHLWSLGASQRRQGGVQRLLEHPAVTLPADAKHRDQRLRDPFRPAAAKLHGIFFSDYNITARCGGPHEPPEIARAVRVMILIRQQWPPCSRGGKRRREAGRVRDPGGRHHVLAGEDPQRRACSRLYPLEVLEREPGDRDRRPGPTAGEPPGDLHRGGRRRVFPGHDDQVGAVQRLPPLAPRTSGQRPGRSRPALGADDRDVHVARDPQQPGPGVQHQHPGSRPPRAGAGACFRVTTIRSARCNASHRSRHGPAGNGQGDPAQLSALTTATFTSRATPSSWYASSSTSTRAPAARVLVLDDAYQLLGVARDVNVAVVSAESWAGSPWPLPAGPWRERWEALHRADLIVVTRKHAPAPARGGREPGCWCWTPGPGCWGSRAT